MEGNSAIRYVKSLERTVEMDHHYLKEAIENLQEMCRIVSPERNVPSGVVVDIRELYKEIQTRLTEIRAIQQLLRGKYHQLSRRDPLRDKELLEIGFIAKTTFSRFESNLKMIVDRTKAKEKEQISKASQRGKLAEWFRSREHQITLLRNMRILNELDYMPLPGRMEEQRDQTGVRSLTLFLLYGDPQSLDSLQPRIRLREHDFFERHHETEIRGVLTHLREVDPLEIERLFQRLFEGAGVKSLKCLLFSVQPHREELDLGRFNLVEKTLREMKEGEIRTLSV